MLQSVFLNVLFMILINNSLSYLNNKNKIMYHFENHFESHYKNNNNLRGNTGILFEKKNNKIILFENITDTSNYEKDHTVNEYEVNLNTDLMKLINDFTIFIMGNDW